ncbi:hypothetical protein ACEWY4_008447 [Coilia grayii]|uniref:Potassium voltage-gated channel subfamily E member 4 n=1 Tax=Coilia grayii TaxID=363190 RepID=A0ABD1KAV8_9TELE
MESWRNESGVGARAPRVDTSMPPSADGEGSARLYILILISFYGVFLLAIMVGYLRSRRRERRRTNVFTRLLHEEEQREWGARLKKDSCASLTFPPLSPLRSVPPPAPAAPPESRVPPPLTCALCSAEHSSVTSLCSSADARLAVEEEGDSGTGEGPEDAVKGSPDSSHGSAEDLKASA